MKAVFVGGQEDGRVMELHPGMESVRFLPHRKDMYNVDIMGRPTKETFSYIVYVLHRHLRRNGKEDLLVYTPANFTYEQTLAVLLNY